MDLKQRLARFDKLAGRSGPQPGESGAPEAAVTAAALAELGLMPRQTAAGVAWVREEVHPDFPSPRLPAPTVPGGGLSALLTGPVPAGIEAQDLLLLDTETTGLAGGAGTLAFLIGTAAWEEGGLRTIQYFLPSPGGEAALLAAFAGAFDAGRRALVTFNGNSYDLPLLRVRGILSGRRDLLGDASSWDLLPAVRRLWGRRLPDCRQQTVEAAAADVGRPAGDIEGSRIPQAWFDFVRGRPGSAGGMAAVLRHNRYDLFGMAAMLTRVAATAARLGRVREDEVADWRDRWCRGRICERAGMSTEAAAWMAAARSGAPAEGIREAGADVAAAFDRDSVRILKRTAAWAEISTILERRLADGPRAEWALREAAILYEHRLADPQRALELAGELGDEHRIERLRRRLGRQPG